MDNMADLKTLRLERIGQSADAKKSQKENSFERFHPTFDPMIEDNRHKFKNIRKRQSLQPGDQIVIEDEDTELLASNNQ